MARKKKNIASIKNMTFTGKNYEKVVKAFKVVDIGKKALSLEHVEAFGLYKQYDGMLRSYLTVIERLKESLPKGYKTRKYKELMHKHEEVLEEADRVLLEIQEHNNLEELKRKIAESDDYNDTLMFLFKTLSLFAIFGVAMIVLKQIFL